MIRRSMREWETLPYGDGDAMLPKAEAARLAEVAERSMFAGRGGEGVLEHRRKGLRAKGVVGILSAPGCQLEILPKIEGTGEDAVGDDVLRKRLVHMLAVARDLRIDASTSASLGWQKDTLLEILIRLFCRKMVEAVRQGMPRRYIAHEYDLPTLRGRLDVTRQFSTLAASPQKLACRYDDLSPDIALNQVMKTAIAKLARLAGAQDNQRTLRELSFAYADISAVPVATLKWDQITLDRTNERWRELLSLARLLLGDRFQTTSSGATDGHALLFEMNVLFEEYIARLLRRALSGTGMRVSTQGGHLDCLYEGDRGVFRTRPDILVKQGDRTVLVVDTKWKRMSAKIDDRKQGVSQGDVYQLMAYSRLYACDRVMLLYPYHRGLPASLQPSSYAIAATDAGERLIVSTVDVSAGHAAVRDSLSSLVAEALGTAYVES